MFIKVETGVATMSKDGQEAYARQRAQRQHQQEQLLKRDTESAMNRHRAHMARYPKDPNNERKLEELQRRQQGIIQESSAGGGCGVLIIAGAVGAVAAGALLISAGRASAEPALMQEISPTSEQLQQDQLQQAVPELTGPLVTSFMVTIEESAYEPAHLH